MEIVLGYDLGLFCRQDFGIMAWSRELLEEIAVTAVWIILLFLSCLFIVFGGVLLRRFLPADHALQKHLTDEAIEQYLAWVMKNGKYVLGGVLIFAFVLLTFLYS
jgi:hypothetical protein